jgi:hypothetical protein
MPLDSECQAAGPDPNQRPGYPYYYEKQSDKLSISNELLEEDNHEAKTRFDLHRHPALVSTPLGSQTPPEKKDLSLTMEEAIVKALKNNLNLAVQIYNPAIAEETKSQAKEYF